MVSTSLVAQIFDTSPQSYIVMARESVIHSSFRETTFLGNKLITCKY